MRMGPCPPYRSGVGRPLALAGNRRVGETARMKRSQLFVAVAALIAIGLIYVVTQGGGGDDGGGGGGGSSAKPASNAVRVRFAYSPEKEVLLKPIIERFNA